MIYTLQNDLISVSIDSNGAQPISLKSLENGKEYIYQRDPNEWPWSAPIMFPQCGNFPEGYKFKGKHYTLTNHGFLRDQEFTVEGNKFSFTSTEETLKVYPFKFKAEIEFILDRASVTQRTTIYNLDDKALPFSIGYHTGYIFHYPTMTTAHGLNVKFTDEYLSDITRYFEAPPTVHVEDDERKIAISADEYTTLLIWAHPKGKDHMVCIEPRIDTDKENNGYPFKEMLESGKVTTFAQTITILK